MGDGEIRAEEMVRSIRDQSYERTKDLSSEELRLYIKEEAAMVT